MCAKRRPRPRNRAGGAAGGQSRPRADALRPIASPHREFAKTPGLRELSTTPRSRACIASSRMCFPVEGPAQMVGLTTIAKYLRQCLLHLCEPAVYEDCEINVVDANADLTSIDSPYTV